MKMQVLYARTSHQKVRIMNFELKTLSWAQAATAPASLLVVLVSKSASAAARASDGPLAALVAQARTAGDCDGAVAKLLQAYALPGIRATKVILAGAGEGSARDVGKAVAAAIAAYKPTTNGANGANDTNPTKGTATANAKAAKVSVVVSLAGLAHLDADAQQAALNAAMQAAAQASYVYTTTKSKAHPRRIALVTMGVPDARPLQASFAQAAACVQGVEFAKEWANRPGNHATPAMLGDAAKSLAKGSTGVLCEVLGPKEVAKLGMGSFMAVAQGSSEPLRFIVLRYNGGAKAAAPTVLVGKGITFDTGGISIKPAAEMDEMKFDMGGAASVLGVFKALGLLKPKINVVGLIPSCENMPDGRAIKPGDVVTSMSGQTIEILNTDAEGRLILCDALTYAERFKPHAVVDIATLTGACVIALGHLRSGLFSANDPLAQALQSAGDAALDPCWRMPLDDEYAEALKSNFADVANVGGRAGGSITAAKFLQRFAGKYPWAHLDIAGTAWKSGAAKGSTGRPVPLLLNYLLNQPLAQQNIAQAAIKKVAKKL
jgi:leucyl aminopeptidase